MNLVRRLGLLASIAALVSGCATAPTPQTITDTLAQRADLSTLNTLVLQAGLADTLRSAGPFTVFAPNNEAFKAVPAKTMAELAADKTKLAALLNFHVLPGKAMAADVKNGNQKSVNGAPLALAKAGSTVTVEDAVVLQADVPVSNGVVHVVDRVLMPPKR
ncbi:MAG: fasciclin domain-containing protein [Rubrivivax sp.]|jgi:uncharacterized surface protein with fasciclin (FAS1) repeats